MKVTELHKPNASDNGSSFAIPLVDITESEYQSPLVILMFGDPGAGKSRFIATAPDPIGLIPLDRKSRPTVLPHAQALGKRVIAPEIDLVKPARAALATTMLDQCVMPTDAKFKGMKGDEAEKAAEREMQKLSAAIRLDGPTPECCMRCYYRWFSNRTKSIAFRMADDPKIKTIAIDTFGQFTDDILFALYGKNEKIAPLDRKSFNREMTDFLNQIAHKHLILTHYSAEIWNDETKKPTGRFKPQSSWKKIGHFGNVVAEMRRVETKKMVEGQKVTVCSYELGINDCQSNPTLIGLTLLMNDDITFANLAQCVYPDAPPEQWE